MGHILYVYYKKCEFEFLVAIIYEKKVRVEHRAEQAFGTGAAELLALSTKLISSTGLYTHHQ